MSIQDCCGEETYNPKLGLAKPTRQFRFANPKNPVPAQIQDAGEYKKFFSVYKDVFVPYAGTDEVTSHSLQAFLVSLCDLSPTQSAVIRSMKSHAFGGKIEIVKRLDPVFNLEGNAVEVNKGNKVKFYEFLKQIELYGADDKPINFKQLACFGFQDSKSNGNYYLEIVKTETLGVKSFKVYTHQPTHCLYLATEKDQQRFIAISPVWSRDYIYRNPPRVLPVYPQFTKDENGTERSILHVKNGNYTWYGRPDSLASMLDQFYEFQNADYKNKQTASNFVGQALIEIESGNPEFNRGIDDEASQEEGFDDFADQFEQNHTNKSEDPQTVIVTVRPYGAKEAFVFQFKPNTNENWYKVTGDQARDNILMAHSWPKHLTGIDTTTGFSTNVYLDIFEIQSVTNIRDIQENIAEPINNVIIAEAISFFEREDLKDFAIEFTSPFKQMLIQRNENANQSMGSS